MKIIKQLLMVSLVVIFLVGMIGNAYANEVTKVVVPIEKISLREISEKEFSENTKLITFDDLEYGQDVSTAYWDNDGVKFLDDEKITPIIITPYNRGYVATASEPNSLSADGDYPETSKNLPLTIIFKEGQSKLGMYIGNGNQYGDQVTARLTAYDQNGHLIVEGGIESSSVYKTKVNDAVDTFIGVQSPRKPIYKVTLDYGDSYLSEEIDNLMFEPWKEKPLVKAFPKVISVEKQPDLLFRSLEYGDSSYKAVVYNNGGIDVSNFQISFTANGVTNTLLYAPTLTMGKSVEIFSWGYNYFGIDNPEEYDVISYLDPNNNIRERDENNNYKKKDKIKKDVEEQQPVEKPVVVAKAKKRCTDYDGGKNYFIKSITSGNSGKMSGNFKDYCSNNDAGIGEVEKGIFVHEYSCDDEGFVVGDTYLCKYGCYDGACMKEKIPAKSPTQPTEIPKLPFIEIEPVAPSVSERAESQCADGFDNDGDNYIDCFDMDCNPKEGEPYTADNVCTLKNHQKTCCLFHNLGYGGYIEDFNIDTDCFYPERYHFDVKHAGRYPVVSEEVCSAGVTNYGYNYVGNLKKDSNEVASVQVITPNKAVSKDIIQAIRRPTVLKKVAQPSEATVALPEKPTQECEGCAVENVCFPIGIRNILEGKPMFCGIEQQMEKQKNVGEECQNNFECQTNFCSNGKCYDIEKELKENKSMMEKIMAWIGRMFR